MLEGILKHANLCANLNSSFVCVTNQLNIYVLGAGNDVTIKDGLPGDVMFGSDSVLDDFRKGLP